MRHLLRRIETKRLRQFQYLTFHFASSKYEIFQDNIRLRNQKLQLNDIMVNFI